MSNITVELTDEEVRLILEDQMCDLQSSHRCIGALRGGTVDCQVENCPPDHFSEIPEKEILLRQALIKKFNDLVKSGAVRLG